MNAPATSLDKKQDHPQQSGVGTAPSTEDRALSLLGSGVPAVSVAAALGVTEARISQLLASPIFADKVATLRYENLQEHTKRDSSYDALEDKLLKKLEKSLPFMIKPGEILGAIKVINGATRRGSKAAGDAGVSSQNIVNIILPAVITQKFKTNTKNQVIKAGEQELLTLPASQLLKQTEEAATEEATATNPAIPNPEDETNDDSKQALSTERPTDTPESLHGTGR